MGPSEDLSRKKAKVDRQVIDNLKIWATYSHTICLRGLDKPAYNSSLFNDELKLKLEMLGEAFLSPLNAVEYEEKKEDWEIIKGDIVAMLPLRYEYL